MVADLLLRGKENATPVNVLCSRLNIRPREVRLRIAKERELGAVILSSSTGGGYYLPADRAEIEEFIKVTNKKAFSTLRTLRSAKELVKAMNQTDGGQIEMRG